MRKAARWSAVVIGLLAASLVLTKLSFLYPEAVPGVYATAGQFLTTRIALNGEDTELLLTLAFALLTVSVFTAVGWYALKKLRTG